MAPSTRGKGRPFHGFSVKLSTHDLYQTSASENWWQLVGLALFPIEMWRYTTCLASNVGHSLKLVVKIIPTYPNHFCKSCSMRSVVFGFATSSLWCDFPVTPCCTWFLARAVKLHTGLFVVIVNLNAWLFWQRPELAAPAALPASNDGWSPLSAAWQRQPWPTMAWLPVWAPPQLGSIGTCTQIVSKISSTIQSTKISSNQSTSLFYYMLLVCKIAKRKISIQTTSNTVESRGAFYQPFVGKDRPKIHPSCHGAWALSTSGFGQ